MQTFFELFLRSSHEKSAVSAKNPLATVTGDEVSGLHLEIGERNIHFYVNKCGFRIVEFFCEYHTAPNEPFEESQSEEGPDEMFRFIKVMK